MKETTFKCDCGRKYKIAPDTYKAQMTLPAPPFPAPGPAPPKAQRVDRARDVDVVVPLFVSLITGGLIAAFMIVMGASRQQWAATGICLTSLTWVVILLIFVLSRAGLIQGLVWAIEDYFSVDIDGDGARGEPERPGRTVINAAPKRPRRWQNLNAAAKLEDRVALARQVYDLHAAGMGAGQRKLRGFGLPSTFKCNDSIHAELSQDLIDAGLAHETTAGLELIGMDSAETLAREVRRRTTIGV